MKEKTRDCLTQPNITYFNSTKTIRKQQKKNQHSRFQSGKNIHGAITPPGTDSFHVS